MKVGDYLYGTTGAALLCLEFQTGQVKWKDRALGAASICFTSGITGACGAMTSEPGRATTEIQNGTNCRGLTRRILNAKPHGIVVQQ